MGRLGVMLMTVTIIVHLIIKTHLQATGLIMMDGMGLILVM